MDTLPLLFLWAGNYANKPPESEEEKRRRKQKEIMEAIIGWLIIVGLFLVGIGIINLFF